MVDVERNVYPSDIFLKVAFESLELRLVNLKHPITWIVETSYPQNLELGIFQLLVIDLYLG
jgi:hypothetical protein